MARRIFTRINSFLSYKFFDRKARKFWQDRWKKRTGFTSARGWNRSNEFNRYRQSIKPRIMLYAERNPSQFFKKKNFVLKYSDLSLDQSFVYGQNAIPTQSFLNPMVGEWGLYQLMEQVEIRSITENKFLIQIARITDTTGMDLLPPTGVRIARKADESLRVRNEIMTNYGKFIRENNLEEDYDLLGANYKLEILTTSTQMLATIDMELFGFVNQ